MELDDTADVVVGQEPSNGEGPLATHLRHSIRSKPGVTTVAEYLNTAHGMPHRSCFLRCLGNTLRSSADGTRASIQVALLNAHRLRGQRRTPRLRCHGDSRERP